MLDSIYHMTNTLKSHFWPKLDLIDEHKKLQIYIEDLTCFIEFIKQVGEER